MTSQDLLLQTLRTNKIKANQMYWNFLNDLKPYFWSSLMYRLINYNNKHHNNCLSTLIKLIQYKHIKKPQVPEVKQKVQEVKQKVQEVKPKVQEVKPQVQEVKPKVQEVKPKVQEVKPKVIETKPKVIETKQNNKENKPTFKGKMPNSAINNFKEYLKNKLNIDSSKAIPRQQFNELCTEYNFNKDNYNKSHAWYEYIKNNMII
tara:strand:+ start:935 stop:1546 length:612 start_codon:yes stop_codon:yes gene_type:complete